MTGARHSARMGTASKKRALVVATSHARLGETGRPTGAYLSELVEACAVLRALDVAIDVASPRGGDIPIDPCSRAADFGPLSDVIKGTTPLASVAPAYDAYLAVGGRGALWDLRGDPHLERLLATAVATGKVVGGIAQGVSILLGLRAHDGTPLVRGRRVTASTDEEEQVAGAVTSLPFSLESELRNAGARFEAATTWSLHVTADQRFITGQNPLSAPAVAHAIGRALGAA
jgi:putative intracellular protease/amidase